MAAVALLPVQVREGGGEVRGWACLGPGRRCRPNCELPIPNSVGARLSSVLRVADLRSRGDKLTECDESLSLIAADVEQLTEELGRVRAGASPLVQWLADRDALLAEKERGAHPSLENEQLLAQRRGEAATAALRDARDLLEEHDARITNAIRELDDLRSTLAERDALLTEKELELTRLENERLQALRGAEDATRQSSVKAASCSTSTSSRSRPRRAGSRSCEANSPSATASSRRPSASDRVWMRSSTRSGPPSPTSRRGPRRPLTRSTTGQRLPATCFLRLSRRAIDWWCPTSRVHDRMTRSMPRANRSWWYGSGALAVPDRQPFLRVPAAPHHRELGGARVGRRLGLTYRRRVEH